MLGFVCFTRLYKTFKYITTTSFCVSLKNWKCEALYAYNQFLCEFKELKVWSFVCLHRTECPNTWSECWDTKTEICVILEPGLTRDPLRPIFKNLSYYFSIGIHLPSTNTNKIQNKPTKTTSHGDGIHKLFEISGLLVFISCELTFFSGSSLL